jgi:SAM-dependent methyltransferase
VLRGQPLWERILAVPTDEREAWVDALLGLPEAPPDEELPRGGAPYLPAGVDDVLTALEGAPVRESDVFVDVGSGLGRVVLLAHLLTGAKAHGIEVQSHLVRVAREAAARLGLTEVTVHRADASDVVLDGTVFFFYSPLTGQALRSVLFSLQNLAERQPIVVCAVGLEFGSERWLTARPRTSASVTFYDAGPRAR